MTFFDAISKHNNGIIGTLIVHMLLFVWFNLENMSFVIINPKEKVVSILDFSDEELILETYNNNANLNELNNSDLTNVVSNVDQKETSFTSENVPFNEAQANKEVMEELKALEAQEFETLSEDNPTLIKADENINNINPNLIKEDADKNDKASYGSNITATAKYFLPNRHALYKKTPSYKCKEQGVVRVNIKVNQKGRVVGFEFDENHTNTSNECLRNNAYDYVKKWRFSQDFNSEIRKQGWIEFTYQAQ